MRDVDEMTRLRAFVAKHGSQRKAATALGVTQAFVNQMLNQKRKIPPSTLEKLGLQRVTVARKA